MPSNEIVTQDQVSAAESWLPLRMYNAAKSRLQIVRMPFNTFVQEVRNAVKSQGRTIQVLDASATLNFSLLTGRQTVSVSVPGLLAADILLQVNPAVLLPGQLGIVGQRITGANTLEMLFSTPVLYTGNTNLALKVVVLRAASA